jgi:hypothetical protein
MLTGISLNKIDLFDTTELDAEFNAHRAKKEQHPNATLQEPTQESHGEGQAGAGEADGEN